MTSRSRSCPSPLATDTERLARFEREAHVLASLNHPHIAQIYDVSPATGRFLLVSPADAGPSLRAVRMVLNWAADLPAR